MASFFLEWSFGAQIGQRTSKFLLFRASFPDPNTPSMNLTLSVSEATTLQGYTVEGRVFSTVPALAIT